MRGKSISISITCLFVFYLLIAPVNAQNTAIKWYKFDEGIDLAKSTGKPIAISLGDFLVGSDEKTYSEINNNFINIYPVQELTSPQSDEVSSYISLVILTNTSSITQPGMSKGRGVQLLILDSNGGEISRIDNQKDIKGFSIFVQLDADGKEIGRIEPLYSNSGETEKKKFRDFFYYAYKYAENKNGKIQRLSQEILPREMDLISVKELLTDTTGKYAFAYVTISGYIRDIKSVGSAYTFAIDDGTSVIHLGYNGGLGDIKEGDKVFVKIFTPHREYKYRTIVSTVSKDKIPTKVSSASSDGSPSAPKTPGFGVTIGVVAIFFVSRKIRNKSAKRI